MIGPLNRYPRTQVLGPQFTIPRLKCWVPKPLSQDSTVRTLNSLSQDSSVGSLKPLSQESTARTLNSLSQDSSVGNLKPMS